MTDSITAYPLCWPSWQPRTPEHERKHAQFGRRNDQGWGRKQLTLSQATNRVLEEVEKFTRPGQLYRTSDLIVSTNLELRKSDGLPRSGQRAPGDTGVAVYFELDGESRCIPCDAYYRIEDNLAAVAATIAALRTIERHGSGMFKAAFTGFTALPDPDSSIKAHWRAILGNYQGSDIDEVRAIWRQLRSKQHPDKGGDDDLFHAINKAWEQAQVELK